MADQFCTHTYIVEVITRKYSVLWGHIRMGPGFGGEYRAYNSNMLLPEVRSGSAPPINFNISIFFRATHFFPLILGQVLGGMILSYCVGKQLIQYMFFPPGSSI